MKAIVELDVPENLIGKTLSDWLNDAAKEAIIQPFDDNKCDGCLVKYHKFNQGDTVYFCAGDNKYEAVIISIDRKGYVIRIEPTPGTSYINIVKEENLILI